MAKKDDLTVQTAFIARLKDALPPNISLADEMSDLFGVSVDSAYRRIRGETALSIDEVVKICTHYKIPFSPGGQAAENAVTFGIRPLGTNSDSFGKYLDDILSDMKRIVAFDDKEIVYAAEELPVFHHYCFKELTAFKFYYWNKSILNSTFTENKKFDRDIIPKEWQEKAHDIYRLYNKIPSTEIWTEDTVNSTLKQLTFYWDSGLFHTKEDALLVAEQLEQMLKDIEKQAEHTSKFINDKKEVGSEKNFYLYQSDVTIGNNCIWVRMKNNMATYISYHTLNFMTATSQTFCEQTDLWLKNLIKKATLLSGVAEKHRYQFFKAKYESINALKERIAKG